MYNSKYTLFVCLIFISTITMSTSARTHTNHMDYDSILALLAEAEADAAEEDFHPYTTNNIPQIHLPQEAQRPEINAQRGSANVDFTITKPSISLVLAPHVEILHIVEAFLRLKGEMASRIHALVNDNFDLFQSIYNLFVTKAAKFHSFTLIGISVIRKIMEFAVQMIGTWEMNSPSVSVGINKVFNAFG